jgi:hypothetical protein
MKLSSTSVAKLLLILSIGIATVSIWKGLEWQRSTDGLTRQLRSAQANEEQARRQVAELSELLPGNEEALPLATTLVRLVATLNEGQLPNRLKIGPLAPATSISGQSVELLQLAQPVEGTDLHSLTLKVRGTYREYVGLHNYINQIQKHPVALTRLSIVGDSFQLNVKVFGTI